MILDRDDGYQEFEERLRHLADERRDHDERWRAVNKEHEEEYAEWETRKREIRASGGGVVPSEPEPPDLSGFDLTGHGFRQRREEIERERDAYLVANRDRLESAAAITMSDLIRQTRGKLGWLRRTANEASKCVADVHRIRRAVDGCQSGTPIPGDGLADRSRRRIDLIEWVKLLVSGEDPLEVAPLPGRPESAPQRVRDEDPFAPRGRQLGLDRPGVFGDPGAPDPDRINATKRTTVQQGIRYRGHR